MHLFAPLRTTAARTVEETVGTTSRSILLGHESPLKAGSSIDSTAASRFLSVLTWRPLLHPYVGHEKAVQAVRTTKELLPQRLQRGPSCHPWSTQSLQPTPSLLGPLAGLLSESTHTIQILAPMPAHMA